MVKSHKKVDMKKSHTGLLIISILVTLMMIFMILVGVVLVKGDQTVSAQIINRNWEKDHMNFTVTYKVGETIYTKVLRYYTDLPGNTVDLHYTDDPSDPTIFSITNFPLGISLIALGVFFIGLTWIIFYRKRV